jgi:hypothetical protein
MSKNNTKTKTPNTQRVTEYSQSSKVAFFQYSSGVSFRNHPGVIELDRSFGKGSRLIQSRDFLKTKTLEENLFFQIANKLTLALTAT